MIRVTIGTRGALSSKINIQGLRNRSYTPVFYLMSMVMFAIYGYIIAYRDPSVGTDTRAYMSLYLTHKLRPDLLQQYEAGFVAFLKMVSVYSNDPRVFIASISLLINTLFYISGILIFRNSSVVLYTTLLLASPFYFSLNTNGLRQGIALGICFLFAGIFFNVRRIFLTAPAILPIIASFHLPMIISYIGFLFKLRKEVIIFIWLMSIILGIFSSSFSSTLSSIFDATKYNAYLEGDQSNFRTGLRIDFIIFSALPILSYLITPRSSLADFKKAHFFMTAYIVINSIGMLINFMPFYSRILLASWAITPIIYALSLKSIKGKGKLSLLRKLSIWSIIFATNILGLITLI